MYKQRGSTELQKPYEYDVAPLDLPVWRSVVAGRHLAWWAHQDLNLEPTDYESAALTIEL